MVGSVQELIMLSWFSGEEHFPLQGDNLICSDYLERIILVWSFYEQGSCRALFFPQKYRIFIFPIRFCPSFEFVLADILQMSSKHWEIFMPLLSSLQLHATLIVFLIIVNVVNSNNSPWWLSFKIPSVRLLQSYRKPAAWGEDGHQGNDWLLLD